MNRALELAARGQGQVSPNPMVGAVIVRDGEIVGEGWHRRLGAAHAEIEALDMAGGRARGADMYVSLEPCNHHGRTPPCAPSLLAAGLRRVVAAVRDPNPRVTGGGLAWLEAHGMEVEAGLCAEEGRALNRAFFTWSEQGRPFVTLKTALTLDGRIACRTGHSQWITGDESRRRVHQERAQHDAILVGVGTVLADDPRLDVRLDGDHRSPRRIVLDSRLRTPAQARMLADGPPPIIFTTLRATAERRSLLSEAGADIVVVEAPFSGEDGGVPIAAVLAELARRSYTSVFVEGGGTVAASFLRAGLVDRMLSFISPLVLTGREAPTSLGRVLGGETPTRPLQRVTVRQSGDDLCIEGFTG